MRIDFETLKARAKASLSDRLSEHVYGAGQGSADRLAADALQVLRRVFHPALVNRVMTAQTIDGCSRERASDFLKSWEKAAAVTIDRWELAQVNELVQHFPEIVPARYRRTELTATYDRGAWTVSFEDRVARPEVLRPHRVAASIALS